MSVEEKVTMREQAAVEAGPEPESRRSLFKPFLKVEFPVELLIGHARLSVGRLLELKAHDTIRLDRQARDNVLLLVGGVAVAEAEARSTEKGTVVQVVDIGEGR